MPAQINLTESSLAPLAPWYRKHRRDLPFRRTKDPYAIWVSEVMLQQTRVAAMLPRYEEFTRRFPDLRSLAASEESDVLAAWRGLGYYSRARNLRLGAQQVMHEHGGAFPRDLAAALQLKGVGPYTAAAVLSIAYDEAHAAFDGNVKRVLARLLHLPDAPEKKLRELAQQAMDLRGKTAPGDHNQAMMELGATVCVPGRPNCSACPVRAACVTFAQGGPDLAAKIPPKKVKAETVDLQLDVYLVHDRRRERLLILREPESRFFRDLWFFPYRFGGDVYFEPAAAVGLRGEGRPFAEVAELQELRSLAKGFKHTITHHRIEGRVWDCVIDATPPSVIAALCKLSEAAGVACEWTWVPRGELEERVVSGIARKLTVPRK